MKKIILYFFLLLSIGCLTSCSPPPKPKHVDPFYNINLNEAPVRFPLIKPMEVVYVNSWYLDLPSRYILLDAVPNTEVLTYNVYDSFHGLENFAIENRIIMINSSGIDKKIDMHTPTPGNYYYWFVIDLNQEISKGFYTEAEFLEYIQMLGISAPNWQTPDEAYEQFKRTGCLKWIPDC